MSLKSKPVSRESEDEEEKNKIPKYLVFNGDFRPTQSLIL